MSVDEHDIRLVEALLFASAQPLSAQDLHERIENDIDVGAALLELQKHYDGRGINLINIDNQWAFRTAVDLAESLQIEKNVQKKLSRAAMETLAIISYHQPVTRAEIENIRGVATHRGTLDALMEMGWVKPGRRRQTPGRPMTWVTSTAFLDHFSLESLMDLPGMDDLKAAGLLDRRPAIETLEGDLFAGQEDAGQNAGEGVERVHEGAQDGADDIREEHQDNIIKDESDNQLDNLEEL